MPSPRPCIGTPAKARHVPGTRRMATPGERLQTLWQRVHGEELIGVLTAHIVEQIEAKKCRS